jgi:hypothetical protein
MTKNRGKADQRSVEEDIRVGIRRKERKKKEKKIGKVEI